MSLLNGHTCVDTRGSSGTTSTDVCAIAAATRISMVSALTLLPVSTFQCTDHISCIAMSDSGNYVAAAIHSDLFAVEVFSVEGGETQTVPTQHLAHRLAFSPNAALLVSVDGEEEATRISVWKWRTKCLVATRSPGHAVLCVKFVPRSNTTFYCAGKSLSFWTVVLSSSTLQCKKFGTKWARSIVSLSVSKSSDLLLFTQGGTLCMFDANLRKTTKWISTGIETGMFMSHALDIAAVGGSHQKLHLVSTATFAFICSAPPIPNRSYSCVSGHFVGSRLLVVVLSDLSIATYRTQATTCTLVRLVDVHSAPIRSLYIVANTSWVCGHEDGAILSRALTSESVRRHLVSPVCAICCNPSGSLTVVGDSAGNVHVFSPDGKLVESTLHTSAVVYVSHIRDSTFLSASSDGLVNVFSISDDDDMDVEHQAKAVLDAVDCIVCSYGPDGVCFVKNSGGATLFTLSEPETMNSVPFNTPLPIRAAAVSGNMIFSGGSGPKVWVHSTDGYLANVVTLSQVRQVLSLAAHPQKRWVAAVSTEYVHILNANDQTIVLALPTQGHTFSSAVFFGSRLYCGSANGFVLFWELGTAIARETSARIEQSGRTIDRPPLHPITRRHPERYTAGDLAESPTTSHNRPATDASPFMWSCRSSGVLMRSSYIEDSVSGRWQGNAMNFFVTHRGRFPVVASLTRDPTDRTSNKNTCKFDEEVDTDDVVLGSPDAKVDSIEPLTNDNVAQQFHVDPTFGVEETNTPPVITKCDSPRPSLADAPCAVGGDHFDSEDDPTASQVHSIITRERQAIASITLEPKHRYITERVESPPPTLLEELTNARRSIDNALAILGALPAGSATEEGRAEMTTFVSGIMSQLQPFTPPQTPNISTVSSIDVTKSILERLEQLEKGQNSIQDMLRASSKKDEF